MCGGVGFRDWGVAGVFALAYSALVRSSAGVFALAFRRL